MMDKQFFINSLERSKRFTPQGTECWRARGLMRLFNYSSWERFETVVQRAVTGCESAGQSPLHHFHKTVNLIEAGKGAKREQADWVLSRYACYLIAMNGDASKPEIGHAQTYFAIQTRRQEIREELDSAKQRIELRDKMAEANKELGAAANDSGVQKWGVFQNAGYQGLYGGLSVKQIKTKKGIPESQQVLDRMGSTELAANMFRATQAADKLRREKIQGDGAARGAHHAVGKAVRDAIESVGGTHPEDIPAEPPIKQIRSKVRELEPGKEP